MTNRERAIAMWRRQGGLGDDFRAEDWPEEIDPIEAELDAAERRARHAIECDTCDKPTGGHDSVTCLGCLSKQVADEKARQADAERRGWIEALEWVLLFEYGPHIPGFSKRAAIEKKFAELQGEDSKP